MNILMLTPRLPYPPTRGDVVRAWSELEYLGRRHDVWLACVDEHPPHTTHLQRVRELCRDVAVTPRSRFLSLVRGGISLLTDSSLTEGFFGVAALKRVLRSWAAVVHFDAVLTFSSAMAPFAELVNARRRVLDMCDVDSFKWEAYAQRSRTPLRWLYALEARRLAAAEGRWVRTHDVTLVVNERERRKLWRRLSAGVNHRRDAGATLAVIRMHVALAKGSTGGGTGVPPVVGCRRDANAPRPTEPLTPKFGVKGEPIVGCIGSMFYPPNVHAIEWFGRNVWPRVKKAVPATRWWIVGNRPVRRVRRWRREPGVTVTGFVRDVGPYLERIRVFVNPVAGELGVQTKLLVAMAAGTPAVVTPDAAAGIDYRDEPPFLIARSPADFADATVQVLTDDALAERLSVRARRVIETDYQTDQHLRRIEQWLAGELPGEQTATESMEKQAGTEQTDAPLPAAVPTGVSKRPARRRCYP